MKAKSITLRLVKIVQVLVDAYSFTFDPIGDFDFIAGQYVQITLSHDADERGTTRFFSIASAPSEKHIMLTIKEGKSSFKKVLFSLKPGDTIDAFGPIGKFTLED